MDKEIKVMTTKELREVVADLEDGTVIKVSFSDDERGEDDGEQD